MSTITFRHGIMAADTRAYAGGNHELGVKTKVRMINGLLVGVSTITLGTSERFFRAIAKGFTIDEFGFTIDHPPEGELGSYDIIVIDKDWNGYLADDNPHFSGPIQAEYFAIGSGRHYAVGAMKKGACAVEALRVAAELDVWSAMPIDAVKHGGKAWRVAT